MGASATASAQLQLHSSNTAMCGRGATWWTHA